MRIFLHLWVYKETNNDKQMTTEVQSLKVVKYVSGTEAERIQAIVDILEPWISNPDIYLGLPVPWAFQVDNIVVADSNEGGDFYEAACISIVGNDEEAADAACGWSLFRVKKTEELFDLDVNLVELEPVGNELTGHSKILVPKDPEAAVTTRIGKIIMRGAHGNVIWKDND